MKIRERLFFCGAVNIFIATFLLQDDLKSILTQTTDSNNTKVLQNSFREKKLIPNLKQKQFCPQSKSFIRTENSTLMQWVEVALEEPQRTSNKY